MEFPGTEGSGCWMKEGEGEALVAAEEEQEHQEVWGERPLDPAAPSHWGKRERKKRERESKGGREGERKRERERMLNIVCMRQ